MLKRGTLGLLLSAIALTGGVLLFENRAGSESSDTAVDTEGIVDTEATAQLLPIEEEEIEQFSVLRAAADAESDAAETEPAGIEELSFVKTDDGQWEMSKPDTAVAENGAIAFLLSQLTSPSARSVAVEGTETLEAFGLANPDYTVTLSALDKDYSVAIGGLDFAGDKRYVQVMEIQPDEPEPDEAENEAPSDEVQSSETGAEEMEIYAAPGDIVNAVNRPTSEWLAADDTANETADDTEDDLDESSAEEETSAAESERAEPE